MKMTGEEIVRLCEQRAAERSAWESHWDEVEERLIPRKTRLTTTQTPGTKKTEKVYDSAPENQLEEFAGNLHGMLCNPGGLWFGVRTQRDEPMDVQEHKEWFQEAAKRMYTVINNSNYHTEVHEMCIDVGGVGIGSFSVEEEFREGKVITCQATPIQEHYIGENNLGVVDSDFRRFKLTARQAVQQYGKENLSSEVIDALEKDPGRKFEFIQAIFPREERDEGKRDSANMEWASVHVETKTKKILRESGYEEFPLMFPRWTKTAGEVYGRGPGMKALAAVKVLYKIVKTVMVGAEKAVDPPLMVPHDGFMLPLITRPSGINFYNSSSTKGETIGKLPTSDKLPIGLEMEEQRRQQIKECFYAHVMTLSANPNMTATEVLQRIQDQVRILGPMIGRMFSEFCSPVVKRIFWIMYRRGMFPPLPQGLIGQDLKVEFISPIAKQQRLMEAQSLVRAFEFLQPLAAVDPELLAIFNTDKAARGVADIVGVPPDWVFGPDVVARQKAARQQAIMEQQAEGQMAQLGGAAIEAAKAGLIPPSAGSILGGEGLPGGRPATAVR